MCRSRARGRFLTSQNLGPSGVVNKYIGETEKNLDPPLPLGRKIQDTSRAWLLGEMDALLDKLSQVPNIAQNYDRGSWVKWAATRVTDLSSTFPSVSLIWP